jgi:hypothetical protein
LICFGVKGDFLMNFIICFCCGKVIISCELHGFFVVASNALWRFADFIATLLLYYWCCIFFHMHIYFLLYLPMLIFFCCLSLCKCQHFFVNWSLFKVVLNIHMVSGLFFFPIQLTVMVYVVFESLVYMSKYIKKLVVATTRSQLSKLANQLSTCVFLFCFP